MSDNRGRAILYGALVGASTVVGTIVVHVIRRGWDDLSEPGYWAEKAVIFVLVTVGSAMAASLQRSGGKP